MINREQNKKLSSLKSVQRTADSRTRSRMAAIEADILEQEAQARDSAEMPADVAETTAKGGKQ